MPVISIAVALIKQGEFRRADFMPVEHAAMYTLLSDLIALLAYLFTLVA